VPERLKHLYYVQEGSDWNMSNATEVETKAAFTSDCIINQTSYSTLKCWAVEDHADISRLAARADLNLTCLTPSTVKATGRRANYSTDACMFLPTIQYWPAGLTEFLTSGTDCSLHYLMTISQLFRSVSHKWFTNWLRVLTCVYPLLRLVHKTWQ
jgi:hypothetical protein